MNASAFAIVGIVGILMLVILGNHLLKISHISPHRFAYSLAGSFALLLFILVLISRPIYLGLITLAFLLSGINFAIGYPIFYFFHNYISNKNH
jgi:hypothetical protein